MATLNPTNQFQSWNLTPKEFLQGGLLTSLQKQVIQNQISQLSLQKNALKFDTVNPAGYAQQEAYLRGQIDALTYLLRVSEEAERQLNPGAQQIDLNGF